MLSLLTALCYGASAILNLKGMEDSNPITGTVITSLVQVLILTSLFLTKIPTEINYHGIIFFIASGILASTLGRMFNFMSIEKLGVAVSSSIMGSNPFFAILFAFLFIGEKISLSIFLGTLLIVSGIIFTRIDSGEGSRISSSIVFPLAAAAFYGASSVVRKIGLTIIPDATFGAVIGSASSFASFMLYFFVTQKFQLFQPSRRSVKFFVFSGIIISVGWLSMFSALSVGNVSVVAALIGANPLFSLLLSFLLLRDVEKFGSMVVLGCIAIVLGVVIISIF